LFSKSNQGVVEKIDIEINASEYELIPRTDTHFWLHVKWKIKNLGSSTYYVLSKGFLSITKGDSLLIDHSTDSGSYLIESQVDPAVQFEILKGNDSILLEYRYPLPRITDFKSKKNVIYGKFAVNQIEPSAAWTNASNWKSIQKWERVVFSSGFRIKREID
jgi:hypothetical protein